MSSGSRLNKFLISAFGSLLLICTQCYAAESYRLEAGVNQSQDEAVSFSSDEVEGRLTIYFSPVQFGGYPYAEAKFVDRHSGFEVSGSKFGGEYGKYRDSGAMYSGAVFFSHNLSPLSVTVSYEKKTKNSHGELENSDLDGNKKKLKFIYHLSRYSALSIAYFRQYEQLVYAENLMIDTDTSGHVVNLHHLSLLEGNRYFSLDVNYSEDKGERKLNELENGSDSSLLYFSAKGVFYPNKTFGIGIEYSRYQDNYDDGEVTFVGRSSSFYLVKYIGHRASAEFTFTQYLFDGDDDAKGARLRLAYKM